MERRVEGQLYEVVATLAPRYFARASAKLRYRSSTSILRRVTSTLERSQNPGLLVGGVPCGVCRWLVDPAVLTVV